MQCSNCLAQVPEDDIYCEECGLRLDSRHAPEERGAGAREEIALSPQCAAITDRGWKRARNEDRYSIRTIDAGWVLVVCDGVSSSEDSQRASVLASEQTAHRLAESDLTDPDEAMRNSIAAAGQLVAELPKAETAPDPASTTIVAALVAGGQITVGWLGDSRAYWIPANGPARPLTSDHSWFNETVSAGVMPAEEAQRSSNAHSITRWLGADAEHFQAEIVHAGADQPGTLLLCTDGLWNYTPEAEKIGELVQSGGDALTVARRLIEFALAGGGHDNVTVAILQLGDISETNGERIQS